LLVQGKEGMRHREEDQSFCWLPVKKTFNSTQGGESEQKLIIRKENTSKLRLFPRKKGKPAGTGISVRDSALPKGGVGGAARITPDCGKKALSKNYRGGGHVQRGGGGGTTTEPTSS